MQEEKQGWQKVVDTLKRFTAPRANELNQTVYALQKQLESLRSELGTLGERNSELESRQAVYARQLNDLLASDASHSRREEELLSGITDLEKRSGDIESEGNQVRDQISMLENTLNEAATRYEATDERIEGLKKDLDGERKRYDANRHTIEERLSWVRNEQESMHKKQADLTASLQRSRRMLPVAAAAALLLGVLVGTAVVRNLDKDAQDDVPLVSEVQQPDESVDVAAQDKSEETGAGTGEEVVDSAALETEERPGEPVQEEEARATPVADRQEAESGTKDPDSRVQEAPVDTTKSVTVLTPDSAPPRPFTPERAPETDIPPDAEAFLTDNARREGVVSLPSGLQYKVLKAGQGKSPQPGDIVILHYRGSLPDGRVFEDSYAEGAPAAYRINEVIPGWREALRHMHEGAQWELYVPPDLADASGGRGAAGFLPRIYQLELISVSRGNITYRQ